MHTNEQYEVIALDSSGRPLISKICATMLEALAAAERIARECSLDCTIVCHTTTEVSYATHHAQ